MWECGLKQIEWSARLRISVVTPYVGVWIETECRRYIACEEEVTPYVGVWIETQLLTKMMSFMASLLMWECGLKHNRTCLYKSVLLSLLMWECGLKLASLQVVIITFLSLLMWECGLKL